MIFRRTLNLLMGSTLLAVPAMANLITNGGFATNPGYQSDLSAGSTLIPGWTVTGPGFDVAWLPTGFAGIGAETGNSFLDLTGSGYSTGAGSDAGVTQTVSLAAGAYTLTFYVGSLASDEPSAVYASAGDQSNVVFSDSVTGAGYHWVLETLNFNVATTGNVAISLVGDSTDSEHDSPYIGLDGVDLEVAGSAPSAAPEPAMALPVFLLLGAGWLFRSRKTRNSIAVN